MTVHVLCCKELIKSEAGRLSTFINGVEKSESWCGKVADSAVLFSLAGVSIGGKNYRMISQE